MVQNRSIAMIILGFLVFSPLFSMEKAIKSALFTGVVGTLCVGGACYFITKSAGADCELHHLIVPSAGSFVCGVAADLLRSATNYREQIPRAQNQEPKERVSSQILPQQPRVVFLFTPSAEDRKINYAEE